VSGQVKDLDSETVLEESTKTYHIGATYDGRYMMLYINGQLESFTPFTGDIHSSPVDMEIGQILPDDVMYSFRGILDEIKIYDYALLPDSVEAESGHIMTGLGDPLTAAAADLLLFPNPAGDYLTLALPEVYNDNLTDSYLMTISDREGRIIRREMIEGTRDRKIDISRLHDGLYILQLIRGHEAWARTFIIEN
jgi:hypothetical protein